MGSSSTWSGKRFLNSIIGLLIFSCWCSHLSRASDHSIAKPPSTSKACRTRSVPGSGPSGTTLGPFYSTIWEKRPSAESERPIFGTRDGKRGSGPDFQCGFISGTNGSFCIAVSDVHIIGFRSDYHQYTEEIATEVTLDEEEARRSREEGIRRRREEGTRHREKYSHIGERETLDFASYGKLILRKSGGTEVWITNTSNMSVAGMMTTETGSLLLFDHNDVPIWQSYDHPTDTLLVGQNLFKRSEGQRPKSTIHKGSFYMTLAVLWTMDDCVYNTVCGRYGACSNGHCICRDKELETYFKQLDVWQPSVGCSKVTPLSCSSPEDTNFVALGNVGYLNYIDSNAAVLKGTNMDSCKAECAKNCTCKAAFFKYESNDSVGDCFLPPRIYTLVVSNAYSGWHRIGSLSYASVGVLNSPFPHHQGYEKIAALGSGLGALFIVFVVIGVCTVFLKKKKVTNEGGDDELEFLCGMPRRFTYKELESATLNFSKKLGGGGFGSVFEGTLGDGAKIAVKRLDNRGQGKKEFVAEVKTVGRIHHRNLIRLIGFCLEKSYMLLVYEHMCNGSLDKWIFHKHDKPAVSWQVKQRIILDIAKGLAYLHEGCMQRIAHFDVKPQNILLDSKFNAKVSDFGLSTLVDRNQSQVMTTLRGTLGYLAPEWLGSKITEKVDVYSFGVVALEIVCGRKNLDYSRSEEGVHLLSILRTKAEQNQLFDLVEKYGEDTPGYKEEALKMIDVAVWCLQRESNRRPSMSVVVKVLEGSVDVEAGLKYSFLNETIDKEVHLIFSDPPPASNLSGPR